MVSTINMPTSRKWKRLKRKPIRKMNCSKKKV